MRKLRRFLRRLTKTQIIIGLIIIIFIVLSITTFIPSLARIANRHTIVNTEAWDGRVATKFKGGDGTKESPFIISNGNELAYLEQTLETMDYKDKYFKLTKDIIMNNGTFKYTEEDGITYKIDDKIYYIDPITNKIYEDKEKTILFDQGPHVKKFNTFESLENFKGIFDGNYFTIKGLYISNTSNELGMFTNLGGDVTNLYLDNIMIYGGATTGALASTSKDNLIQNIMTSGYVISNELKNNNKTTFLKDITIQTTNNTANKKIDLKEVMPFKNTATESIILTGNYKTNTESTSTIKINNQLIETSSFEIDLSSSDLDNVFINIVSDNNPLITLTNLKVKVISNQTVTSGLIGITKNVELRNVINKTRVISDMIAGGLVGANSYALDIKNSYNSGKVTGVMLSGGIIGTNENNAVLSIENAYNSGLVDENNSGSIIGHAGNSNVLIKNTFNITDFNELGIIENVNLNVINSYTTNIANNNFNKINLSNLHDIDFIKNTLKYKEYVNTTESRENAWVIDENDLPILFIDDINNPVATIHAGSYSFNNYSNLLNPIKYNESIKFTIELDTKIGKDTEVFYYISNTVLSKEELNNLSDEWNIYSGLVNIENQGNNIVYAKVVRTKNDTIITDYINTDRLVISDELPSVKVSFDEYAFDTLKTEKLNTIYVDRPKKVKIEAKSLLDDYLDIEYYISKELLMKSQVEQLPNSAWTDFNREVSIDEVGKYIVYAKVTDTSGEDVFVNTDFIEFDGYVSKKIACGKGDTICDLNTISKNSAMNFSFTYTKELDNLNYIHYIESSHNLPINTVLSLIDNRTNEYYEYIVTEEKKKILLTEFYEIGTINNNKMYEEFNYYDESSIIEDFELIIDFKDAEMNNDIMNIYITMNAKSDGKIRKTIFTTLDSFSILNEEETSYLNTTYNGNDISLNTIATTNIPFKTGINNASKNTDLENKSLGITMKIIDSENKKVDFKKLNNLFIKIGNNFYYPDNDSIFRIPLGKAQKEYSNNLMIEINSNKSKLENGKYKLIIENYVSNDEKYYSNKLNNMIEINLNVDNEKKLKSEVTINLSDDSRTIDSKKELQNFSFDIKNPNNFEIKLALYKKDRLTAYNQDYSIIDLNGFVVKELIKYDENIYNLGTSEMIFKTILFEKTGYKLSFLIYDNDILVETIDEYFIVR